MEKGRLTRTGTTVIIDLDGAERRRVEDPQERHRRRGQFQDRLQNERRQGQG